MASKLSNVFVIQITNACLLIWNNEDVLTRKNPNEWLSVYKDFGLALEPVVVPHKRQLLKPLVRQLVLLWRKNQTFQAKESLKRCTGPSSGIFLQRNFLYCGKLFEILHPCFGCSQVGHYLSFHSAEGLIALLKAKEVPHFGGAWVWCCRRQWLLGWLLHRTKARDELVTLCFKQFLDHLFLPLVSLEVRQLPLHCCSLRRMQIVFW